MNKKRKNAFTLIELLAVIVVLAVLALIAVPIVLNIIKDSKKTRLVLSIRESIELKKNIPSNTNTLKMVVQNLCRISLIRQKMLKTELFLMFA